MIPSKEYPQYWETLASDEFEEWINTLSAKARIVVDAGIELLERHGPRVPFPASSALRGTSRFPLRELRLQYAGRPIRIIYAFDPLRRAVLLIGGDKGGDDRWYHRSIPRAERIFANYLDELKRRGSIDG